MKTDVDVPHLLFRGVGIEWHILKGRTLSDQSNRFTSDIRVLPRWGFVLHKRQAIMQARRTCLCVCRCVRSGHTHTYFIYKERERERKDLIILPTPSHPPSLQQFHTHCFIYTSLAWRYLYLILMLLSVQRILSWDEMEALRWNFHFTFFFLISWPKAQAFPVISQDS